jgi:RHS repeat-associated protein
MKQDGNYYFYQNDHLGTPQKMTGVNGMVVWSANYSSFGETTVDGSSTITNNLRFPGQYYDEETGLHYNRFRYYVPNIGRYNRPDPIGQFGNLNTYIYASNSPMLNYDELGLFMSSYQCAKRIGKKYENMPVSDKYQHCMAGGEIYRECGPLTAYAASIGKEIKDMFSPGDTSWGDLMATFEGIDCAKNPGQDECGKPLPLEDCCKRKGRKP